jgi:hypothetical protein
MNCADCQLIQLLSPALPAPLLLPRSARADVARRLRWQPPAAAAAAAASREAAYAIFAERASCADAFFADAASAAACCQDDEADADIAAAPLIGDATPFSLPALPPLIITLRHEDEGCRRQTELR